MPLRAIENVETDGEQFAKIQADIEVCFSEEVPVEMIDFLERQINSEICMLVSYMLGNAQERWGCKDNIGHCDVSTRALAPGEAIAAYYRELADDAESSDGGDDLASVRHEIAQAVAALAKNQIEQGGDKESLYNCMLKAGDRVRLKGSCGTVLPPKSHGQFVVFFQDDSGNEKPCHASTIITATRNGVQLAREQDDNWTTFYEPEAVGIDTDGAIKPIDELIYSPDGGWKESPTTSTNTYPFEYPCGLQEGDRIVTGWGEFDVMHPGKNRMAICIAEHMIATGNRGEVTGGFDLASIDQAFRGNFALVKSGEGDQSKFTTTAPTDSDSKPEPCKPFEYPCGLMEGDVVKLEYTDRFFNDVVSAPSDMQLKPFEFSVVGRGGSQVNISRVVEVRRNGFLLCSRGRGLERCFYGPGSANAPTKD